MPPRPFQAAACSGPPPSSPRASMGAPMSTSSAVASTRPSPAAMIRAVPRSLRASSMRPGSPVTRAIASSRSPRRHAPSSRRPRSRWAPPRAPRAAPRDPCGRVPLPARRGSAASVRRAPRGWRRARPAGARRAPSDCGRSPTGSRDRARPSVRRWPVRARAAVRRARGPRGRAHARERSCLRRSRWPRAAAGGRSGRATRSRGRPTRCHRVRSVLEQQAREPWLVGDPGCPVERALRPELLVRVGAVRIGSRPQQSLGRGDERIRPLAPEIAGVGDVQERQPAERAERHERVDRDRFAEHERGSGQRPSDPRVSLRAAPPRGRCGRWSRRARTRLHARASSRTRARRGARVRASSARRVRVRLRAGRSASFSSPGSSRSRARASGSPARAAASSAFASRRARSRSTRGLHCDHLHARRSADAGRRSSPQQTDGAFRGVPGALPADRLRPRAHR